MHPSGFFRRIEKIRNKEKISFSTEIGPLNLGSQEVPQEVSHTVGSCWRILKDSGVINSESKHMKRQEKNKWPSSKRE